MSAGAIRAGGAFVELFTKNNRLVSGLNDASRRLRAFGTSVQAIGRQMAILGIRTAIPFGLSVRRFAEFDDKMREVQAVTQATDRQLQQLTATAQRLGATTSFTAVEVASLMTEIGRAGFSPDEINAATGAILDMARATRTDATLAAETVAAVSRQFGLAASEANRVADSLTVAANRSVTTVESLAESLQYAGPVAADFNVSLEDTLALLGALGNIGIQGSNAGTALRRLFLLTGTQANVVSQLFGVNAQDAAGNARPLIQVLDEIGQSLRGLGTADRASRLFDLFGFLGITGASGLARNVTNVNELAEALQNAGGAARLAAEQMDAGIGGTIRRTLAAVEGLAIAIGDSLDEALRLVGRQLIAGLRALRDWIRANEETMVIITSVITAVTVLGGALIALGVAFRVVGFAVGALGTVLAIVQGALTIALSLIGALLSPLGLVAAAIAGMVWLEWSEDAQNAVNAVMSGLAALAATARTTFSGIMDAIRSGDIAAAMRIGTLGIRLAWLQMIESLKESWSSFVEWWGSTWIGRMLGNAVSGLRSILGLFIRSTLQAEEAARAAAALSELEFTSHLLDRLRSHREAGGTFETLPANIQQWARERNLHPGATGTPGQLAPPGNANQQQIAALQAELNSAVAGVRLRRDFKALAADAFIKAQPTSATGRNIAAGLQQARGSVDIAGTFSGAAASMLGIGGSVQNVRDEGVRSEIRGLRRDVQEGAGLGVI